MSARHHFRHFAFAGTALSTISLGLASHFPAQADSFTFTSDTRGQPTYFKPFIPFPGTTSPSAWTNNPSTPFGFQAMNFRVRSTGTYTLSAFAGGAAPVGDPTIFLYRAPFNPSAPFNNALLGNDDAVGLNSQIVTTIGAGQNYGFVITSFGGVIGTTLASISGPGEIVLSDAEIATAAQSAAVNVSRLFMGAVQRQISAARNAALGTSPSMASGERVQLASATGPTQSAQAYSTPPYAGPLLGLGTYVWITGFGGDSLTRQDNTTGGTRVRATNYGGAIGIDTRITENIIGGIAFSVGGSKSRIAELSATSDQRAYQVMAYGGWNMPPWYVDGMFGYGYNTFDLSRALPNTQALTSSPHSHQIMGSVEAGYRFAFGAYSVVPFAGVQFTSVFQRGYDEQAGNSGWVPLSVEGRSFVSARSLVGGRFSTTFTLSGMPMISPVEIKPSGYAAWAFEFAGRDRVVFASIVGVPNFVSRVDGARPDQHTAVFGGTIDIAVRSNFALYVGYDGQLGGRTSSHTGMGGLRIKF